MNLRAKIAVVAASVFLAGCREMPGYFASDTTLARAGGKQLQLRDVESVVPKGVTGEDSAAFMKVYVDRWVRKQLKLKEAETLFSASGDDIDKMVEEYRQALLIRKLNQLYVDRSIDTTFTDDEITAYYNAHKADFRLDRTLVKGRIVQFGEGYRQARKLKELMGAKSAAQQQDFRDICEKNDFTVTDFREQWVDFPEFLSFLPTLRSQNYDSVLSSNAVQAMRDSHSYYYFQIEAVRREGEPIPLERLRSTIRRILFNQRQGEIIRSHEEELYNRAVENGEAKILKIQTIKYNAMLKKRYNGGGSRRARCGAFAQKQQVMLDKVVAVVGSSSILYSEVADHARQLTAQRRAEGYTSDRDPMNEALEALMTQKLLFNQAQIDSVKINAGDIASHVEEQVQNMIEAEGSIPRLEAKHHMAIFNIRENMRQRYEEQSYASSMQNEVVSKVAVIPGEVERFYKSIDKDSLPTIAEQYVYAQITRFPKSITQAKQRTRERLLDMRERVITGKAKFENLARMYSQDPGTMMRGGEMDPAPLASLDSSFAAALENMKPGQISEVVESQFGFHIIQMLDKRGSLYHFRHILLRPVYTIDELTEGTHFLDSIANLIRKDSITFEKAALLYSDDATSKMNGGIVSNHDILERFSAFDAKLTVTKFLREDFAHFNALNDYNALVRLKPGEVSEAFLTEDIMGNQLAKVVKLVEIIPTHVASLNEDYLRLEEMALNAKQEKVFKDWLSKKIDAMYVYIDPEFRDGAFENKHWVK